MGIFSFINKKYSGNGADSATPEMTTLLHELLIQVKDGIQYGYYLPGISTLAGIKELKKKEPDYLRRFSLYVLSEIRKSKENWLQKLKGANAHFAEWHFLLKISSHLLKQIPPPQDAELVTYINGYAAIRDEYMHMVDIPYDPLLQLADNLIRSQGLTPALRNALEGLQRPESDFTYLEIKKMNKRIQFLLHNDPAQEFNKHDAWGEALTHFFNDLNDTEKAGWFALFKHCATQAEKSMPSQQWKSNTPGFLDVIGADTFASRLTIWLMQLKEMIRVIHKGDDQYDFLREENHNLLRSLIWCAGFINNPSLNNTLDDYASWAYKKKPGVGAVSAKTGTACMYAFSLLPFKEGVSRLTKFRIKIKNNTILKGIDKIIEEVALKNGVSTEELQEMGVPGFGLDQHGVLKVPFDDYTAVYHVNGGLLHWEKEGKSQKAPPTVVKEKHSGELKELKAIIKEIESLLPVYKDKIEQSYLKQKSWPFDQWKTWYLDHPLLGIHCKKLIWQFGNKMTGIWLDNDLVDADGRPLPPPDSEMTVRLWHPIESNVHDVVAWRNFLQQYQLVQPFKQAYREIYHVTEAELTTQTYSNRFAAHILRQHQFAALCKQRGWQYTLMGQWDSHNTPTIYLPAWNMMAQFYVDSNWQDEAASQSGVFLYIQTDQVRFYRDAKQLEMQEVPAMVFTEMMRDVDLFVGVTSIGNDPNWQDNGDNGMNTYWHNYSFGELSELAKTREEVLQQLIPKLKIRNQCSFSGKFLLVQGKVRSYKIHMGSGNILMQPNDAYLCIVPGRNPSTSKEKLFLPFEGDNLLSIILSKAVLLADDDKITDKTILSQIHHK